MTTKIRHYYSDKFPQWDTSEKRYDLWFFWTLLVFVVFWTLVPIFFVETAYIDITENIVWGRHFQFGYDKNPYFGPWFTRFFYDLTGGCIEINYFFSQLFTAAMFTGMYLLAKKLMNPLYAWLSILCIMMVPFYSATAAEFNDDVMETAFWSFCIYFFYLAVKKQSIRSWCLLGLMAGLSFMVKYFGIFLFLPMGIFLLLTGEGRESFKKPGIYLASLIFLLISAPNIYWLFNNDLVAVNYAFERSGLTEPKPFSLWEHLDNPLSYFFQSLGPFVLISALTLLAFFVRDTARLQKLKSFNGLFIVLLYAGPFFLIFLFSLITGGQIKFSWMAPCYMMTGICLFYFWPPKVTKARVLFYGFILFCFMMALFGDFIYNTTYKKPYLKRGCGYELYPAKAVSKEITEAWKKRFGTPLKYVVGDRREACNIAVYSPDQPEAFFSANKEYSQWINEEDLHKTGAALVWSKDDSELPSWYGKYKDVPKTKIIVKTTHRAVKPWIKKMFGGKNPKEHRYAYTFLIPLGKKNTEK